MLLFSSLGTLPRESRDLHRNPEQSCATRFGTPAKWGLHHPQTPAAPLISLNSGFFNLLKKSENKALDHRNTTVLRVMANAKSNTGFESKCHFCRGLWFRGKVRALPVENHDIFYTTLTHWSH